MSSSIEWLLWPGLISLVIGVVNEILYEPGKSPLNGLFSIGMSIWAVTFVIVYLTFSLKNPNSSGRGSAEDLTFSGTTIPLHLKRMI